MYVSIVSQLSYISARVVVTWSYSITYFKTTGRWIVNILNFYLPLNNKKRLSVSWVSVKKVNCSLKYDTRFQNNKLTSALLKQYVVGAVVTVLD